MTPATTIMTPNVTMYCVLLTWNVKRGGTNTKSNTVTPSTDARMAGPRPSATAHTTTASRYNMARFERASVG